MAPMRPERVLLDESSVMVCAAPLPTWMVMRAGKRVIGAGTAPSEPMSGVELV